MRISEGKIVIKDARGVDSVTLPLVYAAFVAVMIRFLAPPFLGYENMDGVDFGAAIAAIGVIWGWRELQARPKA